MSDRINGTNQKMAMDEEMKTVVLYDAESDTEQEFELVDSAEKFGKNFYMLAEIWDGSEGPDEDFDEEDFDDIDADAFLFCTCEKEEAEFTMTLDGKDVYVTTMMSDEEFNAVADLFEQSGEYDIEKEEE